MLRLLPKGTKAAALHQLSANMSALIALTNPFRKRKSEKERKEKPWKKVDIKLNKKEEPS